MVDCTVTNHAIERIAGRLSDCDKRAIIAKMDKLSITLGSQNCAVVLARNSGTSRSADGSNGRVIVGIWRGRWVTVMLRREGQGFDPRELKVSRVIFA